jgi:pSer/pThr/pTyr-binding forkhead associated (FHA) protein
MPTRKYMDFDLLIEPAKDGYRVRVLQSPAGNASKEFTLPFSKLEIENYILKLGAPRRGIRRVETQEVEAAKEFGGKLYSTVFNDDIQSTLRSSLDEAGAQGAGLRIRLRFDSPELAGLPWEFLYNPALNRFLSLSVETPIVRYIELPERIKPLAVKPPLKVLVMISSPAGDDFEPLDVEREWSNISKAMEDLQKSGLVVIDRLEPASLSALRRQLRMKDYNIFHFVGHGAFDETNQDGVLVMENEQKAGVLVSGQDLGVILEGYDSLRLAVVNACEGARTSASDPFAGVAQSLIQQGIPAVIAMQFAVTDKAAVTFAHELYSSITSGLPVDAALAEARRAIYTEVNTIEWATPVLFMRSPDGQIFDITSRSSQTQSGLKPPSATLLISQGAQAGQSFTLKADAYILGRDETATIPLQDGQVSRKHAKIAYLGPGYLIEDLGSRNGTFVNGLRVVSPVHLRNGDTIQIGGINVIFQQSVETRTPPPRFQSTSIPSGPLSTNMPESEEQRRIKIATLWAEAQAARSQRKWETEIADLEVILSLDPTFDKARNELSYAKTQLKASALYAEAQAAQARNDWDTALIKLQAILNLEPGHTIIREEIQQVQRRQRAAGLYDEAQNALSQGDLDMAIAKLQATLAIEPAHPRAKADLGKVQVRQRQEKIKAFFNEAQEAKGQENWALAASRLQALLAIDPGNEQARKDLNTIVQEQRHEKIAALYAESQAAQAQGNWALTANKLQAILALEPGNSKIRFELGQAQKQQKINTLLAESRAAEAQGNWSQAENRLKALLVIDPANVEARDHLTSAQQNLLAQKVEALYQQAQAHYAAGRQRKALETFYQVKSLAGDYQDTTVMISALETSLGSQNLPPVPAGIEGMPRQTQEPAGRLYDAPGLDQQQLAEEMRQYFLANGYETQVVDSEKGLIIQGKKGGIRSLVGMGQATSILIELKEEGWKVSIGGGKWLEQGAAMAVGLFVLWPLLLTGGVGMIQQKSLIDTLWRMIEARISATGGQRIK